MCVCVFIHGCILPFLFSLLKGGGCSAAAGSAEEVEKKDKPVANIAAHNVIIICGNF